jgi:hypothetical protein
VCHTDWLQVTQYPHPYPSVSGEPVVLLLFTVPQSCVYPPMRSAIDWGHQCDNMCQDVMGGVMCWCADP